MSSKPSELFSEIFQQELIHYEDQWDAIVDNAVHETLWGEPPDKPIWRICAECGIEFIIFIPMHEKSITWKHCPWCRRHF